MKYFFFIFSLSLFLSCSDDKPNDSNAKKSNNTESSDKENLAKYDKENLSSLDSYLIISALHEDFPSSKGENNEINWPSDSLTKRYSRKYVQLDELIEGRRVFSDTSGEQFFFYFPHNKCWMLHSEFPNEEVLNTLKKSIGGSFSDVIAKNESYRFGFEYGETDSWNLEKLAFSQSPWNYSSSENFVNNLDKDAEGYQTSMYEVKWVGDDPMVALKANWIKKQKTKRYDDWVAAYERYIDAPSDNLFVPKPIPIDYRIALKDPISDFDGFGVLRAYFIDQYKFIDVVLDTEDVYIENDRISQFVTFNSNGDRIIAPEYSNGFEMVIKTLGDSVILPWINSSTENFGSGISYTTNYISYQRLMDDKMWDGGQSFNLPNLDTKYVMTLLEFLFSDTFVYNISEGNTQYVERVYTMPEDPKRDLPLETGCWFEVSKTGIEFICDRGGC